MAGLMDEVKRKVGVPVKDETGRGDRQRQSAETPEATQAPGEGGTGGGVSSAEDDGKSLEQRLEEALRTIYDPEIPVNIYDLGLIYTVDVNEDDGTVYVEMTLTAPGCPVAQTFPGMVEARLAEVPGVEEVTVKLVWDPPWTQDRMSEAARMQLGMF